MNGAKCTGHNRAGEPCGKWPVDGWTVCNRHGAGGGRPIEHGRYSKALPARLATAYEESRGDVSLTDLIEPLALLDSLTQRAAERVGELDTPDFRMRALELWGLEQFTALGDLLQRGASEVEAEAELRENVKGFSLRAEEAWRIKLARGHVVNAKDLVGILSMILSEIRARCPPEIAAVIVRAIEVRIGGLLGMQERPQIEAADAEIVS